MRTPSSGSIEQIADSATTTPEAAQTSSARAQGYRRPVRTFRYVIADVFTDRPLTGNQLAVFTDARGLEDDEMQDLAREMKFSESVFVLPAEGDGHALMRIFTPSAEIPFAGHPTLGCAFVLAGPMQLPEIRLETKAGVVPVALEREQDRIVFGRMEQPLPTWRAYEDEAVVLAGLGQASASQRLPICACSTSSAQS
jgi:trans-2,3-dihydro-3-hydroxyanthranilate isomerase